MRPFKIDVDMGPMTELRDTLKEISDLVDRLADRGLRIEVCVPALVDDDHDRDPPSK